MTQLPQSMIDGLFTSTRRKALEELQVEYDAATSSASRERIKRAMMFIAGPIMPEPAGASSAHEPHQP